MRRKTAKAKRIKRSVPGRVPVATRTPPSDADVRPLDVTKTTINVMLMVLFTMLAVHLFIWLVPYLKPNGYDRETFRQAMLLHPVLGLVSLLGMLFADRSLRRGETLKAVAVMRLLTAAMAAIVGVIATAVLSMTHAMHAAADFAVQHYTLVSSAGTEVVTKILDWIAGGAVFEVFRRMFSRLTRSSFRNKEHVGSQPPAHRA